MFMRCPDTTVFAHPGLVPCGSHSHRFRGFQCSTTSCQRLPFVMSCLVAVSDSHSQLLATSFW